MDRTGTPPSPRVGRTLVRRGPAGRPGVIPGAPRLVRVPIRRRTAPTRRAAEPIISASPQAADGTPHRPVMNAQTDRPTGTGGAASLISSLPRQEHDQPVTATVLRRPKHDQPATATVLRRPKHDQPVTATVLRRPKHDQPVTATVLRRPKHDQPATATVLRRPKHDQPATATVLRAAWVVVGRRRAPATKVPRTVARDPPSAPPSVSSASLKWARQRHREARPLARVRRSVAASGVPPSVRTGAREGIVAPTIDAPTIDAPMIDRRGTASPRRSPPDRVRTMRGICAAPIGRTASGHPRSTRTSRATNLIA